MGLLTRFIPNEMGRSAHTVVAQGRMGAESASGSLLKRNRTMRVLPQMINTVLPIFLVIGVGYILRYREFLTNDTNDRLSKLVFYIALPALLFKSTASTPLALAVDSRTLGCAAGVMVFTAFALYAAAFRMDPSRRGVFTQGAMRSNMGYW